MPDFKETFTRRADKMWAQPQWRIVDDFMTRLHQEAARNFELMVTSVDLEKGTVTALIQFTDSHIIASKKSAPLARLTSHADGSMSIAPHDGEKFQRAKRVDTLHIKTEIAQTLQNHPLVISGDKHRITDAAISLAPRDAPGIYHG